MNSSEGSDSIDSDILNDPYGESKVNTTEYIEEIDEEIERLQNKRSRLTQKTFESENEQEVADELESVEEQIERLENKKYDVLDQRSQAIGDLKEHHRTLVEEYENELNKIQTKRRDAEEIEEKLSNLEETASDLLDKTTSSALGEEFSDRKEEMERPLLLWKVASAASIGLLLLVSGIIYMDIGVSNTSTSINIAKIALLLPISVAVWFCVSNYNRQKKLMEEYEFKSRMAVSLVGFREVLNTEVEENNNEEVIEFMTNTMDKIHSNPQENIDEVDANNEDPRSTQTALLDLIRKR